VCYTKSAAFLEWLPHSENGYGRDALEPTCLSLAISRGYLLLATMLRRRRHPAINIDLPGRKKWEVTRGRRA